MQYGDDRKKIVWVSPTGTEVGVIFDYTVGGSEDGSTHFYAGVRGIGEDIRVPNYPYLWRLSRRFTWLSPEVRMANAVARMIERVKRAEIPIPEDEPWRDHDGVVTRTQDLFLQQ